MEPWQRIHYPSGLPESVGRVEADAFDPLTWKPEYPNPRSTTCGLMTRSGRRRSCVVLRRAIAAIVARAKYTDARATSYITQALITVATNRKGLAERRESTGGF
jgi:hypothetical protein